MADNTNIHEAGVQINFRTWERFNLENLTNDGVVLFQYLVFHCRSNAQWTHSDNGLRAELGIKRSRLTKLRREFESWGILDTRIVKDRNDNDIRAYRLNFSELAKPSVLKRIYREQSPLDEPYDLSGYARIYEALAVNQPKLGAGKTKVEQLKESEIKEFAAQLKQLFDKRRALHNKNVEKGEFNRTKRFAEGSIVFSPKHIKQLAGAVQAIGDKEYIQQAFMSYCDAINFKVSGFDHPGFNKLLPEAPRSPLSYFLSYSTGGVRGTQGYSVIHSFGDFYTGNYGRT